MFPHHNTFNHDDAYVKLIKPTMKQNWHRYHNRESQHKNIRTFVLWLIVLLLVSSITIVLVKNDTVHSIATSRPNTLVAKVGDSGQVITNVQSKLAEHGYTVIVDGIFGPQTQQAVLDWQKSNSLSETGVIDTMTLQSLNIDPDI